MAKYIREDGKVAILIATGGKHWWSKPINRNNVEMLMDSDIVQHVINGDSANIIQQTTLVKCPDADVSGADSLTIEWLDEGTRFRVRYYLGSESVYLLEEEEQSTWYIA